MKFARIEDADAALADFAREPLPDEAVPRWEGLPRVQEARRNQAFAMPDFYVGAHAVVGGMTLLTRDAARYRTYFPALNIVAPA